MKCLFIFSCGSCLHHDAPFLFHLVNYFKWFSLCWWLLLLLVTSSVTTNQITGGEAILQERLPYIMSPRWRGMQALPKCPPPPLRTDGVDIIETLKEDDRDNHDGKDAEENKRGSSSDRWVLGSGPLGCLVLLQGSFGHLAPPVPKGGCGRPLLFLGHP
jgi:hypothetical protein